MSKPENIDEAIEYFRNLGIEPIVLDSSEPDFNNVLNAITEAITGTQEQTETPLDTQNNNGTNHQ
ncbi:MAG: hypothetical protein HC785_29105 [Calothrix sp. CSU_2_0]|nr:hypothetical protein [Calothrix sp. CSU_2_0]